MALYIPQSILHLARSLYVRPETYGPTYVEVSACDKADDSKGKKMKDGLVDYVHQGNGAESKPRMDLCETGEDDLGARDKYQKWTWRN